MKSEGMTFKTQFVIHHILQGISMAILAETSLPRKEFALQRKCAVYRNCKNFPKPQVLHSDQKRLCTPVIGKILFDQFGVIVPLCHYAVAFLV